MCLHTYKYTIMFKVLSIIYLKKYQLVKGFKQYSCKEILPCLPFKAVEYMYNEIPFVLKDLKTHCLHNYHYFKVLNQYVSK